MTIERLQKIQEYFDAVDFLQKHGYPDWKGNADEETTTLRLSYIANLLSLYARQCQPKEQVSV